MNYYHIDSFAAGSYKGNPAGVCILGSEWPSEDLMQSIAFEINLSETAFVICRGGEYHIRWFTPTVEVDLCGHATFAAFYALVNFEGYKGNSIVFRSASGSLRASRDGDLITIDLPAAKLERRTYLWDFECFDSRPAEVYAGKNEYLFVFEREEQVANIEYDLVNISRVDSEGIIVTAPAQKSGSESRKSREGWSESLHESGAGHEGACECGAGCDCVVGRKSGAGCGCESGAGRNYGLDFVSRYFGPNCGIPEDPVTGSAHTLLVPYWAERLGKTVLEAAQLSKRGGRLSCRLEGSRVLLSGHGAAFMQGRILNCGNPP